MQTSFLVISDGRDMTWLQAAFTTLGSLEVMSAEAARSCQTLQRYVLIIIDTTSVPEYVPLIVNLRQHAPAAQVIVVAASPSWPSAREALRAGAADYLSTSMRPRDFIAALVAILARPVHTPGSHLQHAREVPKETT